MNKRIYLVLLILIYSTSIYSQESSTKKKKVFTFKDAVKDPNHLELMHASEEEFQKLKKEAQSWPQEKFDKLVDWFVWKVDNQEAGGELRRLLIHLRPRAQKRLIEILNDNSSYKKLTKIVKTESLPEAPFHRVCYLFEDSISEKFIEPLSKFTKEKNFKIRKRAYEAIAEIRSGNTIPYIRSALLDKDPIASSTLMKFLYSFRNNRKIGVQEKTLIEPLLRYFNRKPQNLEDNESFDDPFADTDSKEYVILALILLDKKRAVEIFLNPKYLNLDNPNLDELLKSFSSEKDEIGREFLLKVINSKNEKHKRPRLEALTILAKFKNQEDLVIFQSMLSHEHEYTKSSAAYALLIFHDLYNFDVKIWEVYEKQSFEKLNKFQRYYLATNFCEGEVNNGGFDQYFFNSYSIFWKDALEGFKAMEDSERYEILKSAIEKFGKNGPPTDRGKRMNQLSEIANKDKDAFDEHDSNWYSCKVPFAVNCAKFVIKNAKHFK